MKDGRDETELERWDRNFIELLQELRVAQTGVQILFGFLLTLPFSAQFGRMSGLDKAVYVATLMAGVTTTILLIAPVAHHRLLFRRGRKREVVETASRFAEAGLAALLLTVIGALFVVLDVVVGLGWAGGLVVAAAGLQVTLWYLLPALIRRGRRPFTHDRRLGG